MGPSLDSKALKPIAEDERLLFTSDAATEFRNFLGSVFTDESPRSPNLLNIYLASHMQDTLITPQGIAAAIDHLSENSAPGPVQVTSHNCLRRTSPYRKYALKFGRNVVLRCIGAGTKFEGFTRQMTYVFRCVCCAYVLSVVWCSLAARALVCWINHCAVPLYHCHCAYEIPIT